MDHIQNPDVAAVYSGYPVSVREKLLQLREKIYSLAIEDARIGDIEECLKWGEPSYLPHSPKSGTTIRIAYKPRLKKYGVYVSCQTRLVSDFQENYPSDMEFDKNRGILCPENETLPENLIAEFLRCALTHHLK